ncbi:MAG: GWxTD domain-containing protein, partial [candidate division Zixibacteria bacterium]|nr:GWxTD domain-containing protein [candidate division Zixibacteria bacterium]
LELYYSLNRKQLEFVPQKEGYLSGMVVHMVIKDEDDSLVEDRMWRIGSWVESLEKVHQQDYFTLDVVSTILSPGKYNLEFEVEDVITEKEGKTTKELVVKDYNGSGLMLSDVETAYKAEQADEVSKFTKGSREVMLNSTGFFNADEMMLYFYSEIYGLTTSPIDSSKYKLNYSVFDTNGNLVTDFGDKEGENKGGVGVIMGGINISAMPVGEYLFKISAQDLQSKNKAEVAKKFFVFKAGPVSEPVPSEPILTEKEAENTRKEIVYIASPSELKLYDELNLTGKTGFLKKFWKDRDSSPETPENEFKIEHYRRWNYANEHFSRTSGSKSGWNTDMGRIYIKYGEPDEIERYPSSRDVPSYEKWIYDNLQGGVYFIFVELEGYGTYTLVHSTAKNEIKDLRWLEKIGETPTPYDRERGQQ